MHVLCIYILCGLICHVNVCCVCVVTQMCVACIRDSGAEILHSYKNEFVGY